MVPTTDVCNKKHTGFVPFFEQKLQGLYKDFQGHISHFSRTPFSAKKRFESMSFLVLPQHEQFYPEGLSYQVLENLGWIKLAPKFKDFPAPTTIFKDFQGLELFISNFKDFQGLSRCVRTLSTYRLKQEASRELHKVREKVHAPDSSKEKRAYITVNLYKVNIFPLHQHMLLIF